MISWELMRDLAQLSGLIVGWALFIGAGISGLTVIICAACWLFDQIKREFR